MANTASAILWGISNNRKFEQGDTYLKEYR